MEKLLILCGMRLQCVFFEVYCPSFEEQNMVDQFDKILLSVKLIYVLQFTSRKSSRIPTELIKTSSSNVSHLSSIKLLTVL